MFHREEHIRNTHEEWDRNKFTRHRVEQEKLTNNGVRIKAEFMRNNYSEQCTNEKKAASQNEVHRPGLQSEENLKKIRKLVLGEHIIFLSAESLDYDEVTRYK